MPRNLFRLFLGSALLIAVAGVAPASALAQSSPPSSTLLKPKHVSSTNNSQLADLAVDGNLATEFVTQMVVGSPPTWAWLRADFGRRVQLTRIEWAWSATGAADDFTVEASNDGRAWSQLGQPGEAAVGAWTGIDVTRSARYVRFYWKNPAKQDQLGHLGEIRFYGSPADSSGDGGAKQPATNGPTSAAKTPGTPVLKDGRYLAVGSSRSPNSPALSSKLALDGKDSTAWQTAMAVAPKTGWVMYDLGYGAKLASIRWKFNQLGGADQFFVQTSIDGSTFHTLQTLANTTAVNTWQSLDASLETRFVRFYFLNPNSSANLGYLSEVQFFAAT